MQQPVHSHDAVIFTCPMHPEIRRTAPGACPICGMALEPAAGDAGGGEGDGELAAMSRRFWISAFLTVPVVLIDMAPHFGLHVFTGTF